MSKLAPSRRESLLNVALVAAAIFVTGRLGLELALAHVNVTPLWPPAGIAVAALSAGGLRLWPGVAVGALAANLSIGTPTLPGLGFAVANTIQALFGGWLLLVLRFDHAMTRVKDVLRVVAAALAVPLVGASIGTGVLAAAGLSDSGTLPELFLTWWTGDGMGILLVLPLIGALLAWRPRLDALRVLEGGTILGLIALVTVVALHRYLTISFLLPPLVTWAAMRFAMRGAVASAGVIALVALAATSAGAGPFVLPSTNASMLYVQGFSATVLITAMLIAAASSEREHLAAQAAGRNRLAFLAEAGRHLSAHLDEDDILRELVEMTVPRLGCCAVAERIEGPAERRLVALAGAEGVDLELVRAALSERPGSREDLEGTDVTQLRAASPDERRLLAALRPATPPVGILSLPLGGSRPARVRIAVPDGPEAREDVLELAEALRARADLALENAALLASAHAALEIRHQFLGVAAHELKTPLTSIYGLAQLMLRLLDAPEPDPARMRTLVETAVRQSAKLKALIEQLLDLSRIDAGKLALEPRPGDLATVARAAAVVVASQTERLIRVSVSGDTQAVFDAIRLEQVAVNLLTNAHRHSPPGLEIDLDVEGLPDLLWLRVIDRGKGLPATERARVLERFQQFEPQPGQAGLGLGLSICRDLVELHGGRIEFADTPGGGLTVAVAIPRRGFAA